MGENLKPEESGQKEREFLALKKELKDILIGLYETPNFNEVFDEFHEFLNRLKEKYPDHNKYKLWHIFGSTVPEEADLIDFEGEDSVEKYIRNLAIKYPKKWIVLQTGQRKLTGFSFWV